MPEIGGKQSTKLEPATTWTVVTDSPLKGLAFAREAGAILAWDEGNQLYLLNTRGETLSTSRVPREVLPFSSVLFPLTGLEGKVIHFMQADRGVFAKYHF